MIETVRARLTLWYVAVLAAALFVVGGLIYVLLAGALYARIDDNLKAVVEIAMTSLANDLAEGQDTRDAARSTAAELASRQQMLAIYDATGQLLAEEGRDDDLEFALPPLDMIPTGDVLLRTKELFEPIQQALVTRFGDGKWLMATAGSSPYLNYELIEKLQLDASEVRRVAAAAAARVPHVARVYTRDELLRGNVPNDRIHPHGCSGKTRRVRRRGRAE